MTREEALRELQQPTYDPDLQERDKAYVAKKLGFTADEFEAVLTQPNVPHEFYGTDVAQRASLNRKLSRLVPLKRAITGR